MNGPVLYYGVSRLLSNAISSSSLFAKGPTLGTIQKEIFQKKKRSWPWKLRLAFQSILNANTDQKSVVNSHVFQGRFLDKNHLGKTFYKKWQAILSDDEIAQKPLSALSCQEIKKSSLKETDPTMMMIYDTLFEAYTEIDPENPCLKPLEETSEYDFKKRSNYYDILSLEEIN